MVTKTVQCANHNKYVHYKQIMYNLGLGGRRYGIILKYLGINKYPVLLLTLKFSICSYSVQVKMCLTSHNLSGSAYLLTPFMQVA